MYSKHKRSWLLGLFVECPFGEELETCPAREIRKLSLSDKLQIAEGVSHEVLDRFLNRHQMCLNGREQVAILRASR